MKTRVPTNAVPTESRDSSILKANARNETVAAAVIEARNDPLVLVGADPEVAAVVRAVAPQDDQPAERQADIGDQQ